MQFDTDFQEEFNRIMDDLSIPEANKDFTRDFFDDTDLTTELAIPRDASGPEYARAATRLRDKMDCRLAQLMTTRSRTSACTEVDYPDGQKASLAANTIAKNMFAQVDHASK
jgi:hypothetical protein